jgi:glycyl-tRNA synthetase beta chain
LNEWVEGLSKVVFHAKLGTLEDKIYRVQTLATYLAVFVPHAALDQVERAAELCKADLVTGMVGEFPELQGIMGAYYAHAQAEPEAIADAIREHYLPTGASSPVPTSPVSVTLALADKMDTLVGLFAAGEKPTGSKDPYALRRQALGILRIILENELRIPLGIFVHTALNKLPTHLFKQSDGKPAHVKDTLQTELLTFFSDRLKVMMKDQGLSHDIIQAVFNDGKEDDVVRLTNRAKAIKTLLGTTDGEALLAAYRRASNIVNIEEKKDNTHFTGKLLAKNLVEKEEITLYDTLRNVKVTIKDTLKEENFADAMMAVAKLRVPLDDFFDQVTVNDDKATLRKARLNLLADIRNTVNEIANFVHIEG